MSVWSTHKSWSIIKCLCGLILVLVTVFCAHISSNELVTPVEFAVYDIPLLMTLPFVPVTFYNRILVIHINLKEFSVHYPFYHYHLVSCLHHSLLIAAGVEKETQETSLLAHAEQ